MVFMSTKESEIRQNTMYLHLSEILDHDRRLQTRREEEPYILDTSITVSIVCKILSVLKS